MVIDVWCQDCQNHKEDQRHTCDRTGCENSNEHHPFVPGAVDLRLTAEQVALIISQGNDSFFKGNDVLYPIYVTLKKEWTL